MNATEIKPEPRHFEIARSERAIGCAGEPSDSAVTARALYHARIEAAESRYTGMTPRERSRAQLVNRVGETAAREMMPHLFD